MLDGDIGLDGISRVGGTIDQVGLVTLVDELTSTVDMMIVGDALAGELRGFIT